MSQVKTLILFLIPSAYWLIVCNQTQQSAVWTGLANAETENWSLLKIKILYVIPIKNLEVNSFSVRRS